MHFLSKIAPPPSPIPTPVFGKAYVCLLICLFGPSAEAVGLG